MNLFTGGRGERILISLHLIAEVAKRLEVPGVVGSSLRQRPDVIDRESILVSAVISVPAPDALVTISFDDLASALLVGVKGRCARMSNPSSLLAHLSIVPKPQLGIEPTYPLYKSGHHP